MRYIAFLTKGLEDVATGEIKELLVGCAIEEVGTKRIIFSWEVDSKLLTTLKTVDDVGILIGFTKAVKIEEISSWINDLNFETAKQEVNSIRKCGDEFSITVTISGTQGFDSKQLMDELSLLLANKLNMKYLPNSRADTDVRIFIDHNSVYVALRLNEESLHRRSYKTHFKEGSLKATIAAAMVRMACGNNKQLRVVDNLCGSGTMLAEAVLSGQEVYGGDIDQECVDNTLGNLANLRYPTENKIKLLDATKTNWPSNFFDCCISNLPWGKQIEIVSITKLYTGVLKEYRRMLKPEGKLCLIVANPELLIKHVKELFPDKKISTTKIGYLGQTPTIVLVS